VYIDPCKINRLSGIRPPAWSALPLRELLLQPLPVLIMEGVAVTTAAQHKVRRTPRIQRSQRVRGTKRVRRTRSL